MKRITKTAPLLTLALNLLLPAGGALCALLGYELDLVLPRTIMAAETAVMIVLAILLRRCGSAVPRQYLIHLLTPAAAVFNVFCFTMARNSLQQAAAFPESLRRWQTADVVWTVMLGIVILVCALQSDRSRPRRIGLALLKIPLHGLPALLCVVWLLSYLLMGNLGMTYVGTALPSPDNQRIAIPIVHDEGALGGSTCVEIRSAAQLHLGAAVIRSAPMRITSGDWRPIEEMEISWIDTDTLMINGQTHVLLTGGE